MAKNFGQLKQSVKAWLVIDQEDDDERLPDQVCGDLLNWAIADYLRRRESQYSEASYAFLATIYQPNYQRPADFSKGKKIWYLSNDTNKVNVLTYLDKDEFDVRFPQSSLLLIEGAANLLMEGGGELPLEGGGFIELSPATLMAGSIGQPCFWTQWKDQFILGPCPDGDFTIFVDYYKFLSTLVEDTDHNIFTDKADQYIIFKALADAEMFGIEDERIPLWMGRVQQLEIALDLESSRQSTVPRTSQSREPGRYVR